MEFDLSIYKGKSVFVTGHTGFKGSWLCKILSGAGAVVTGYSLNPPTEPSLFEIAGIASDITSVIGDIRDYKSLKAAFDKAQPEIVLHLAAQPIVRDSYKEPAYTYETNVMGTVNILECVRNSDCVKSFLNVTTDKVYLNEDKDKALAAVVGVDGDALTKELADEYVFGLSDDDEPGCELIFDIWKDVVYPEVVKQEYKPEPVLNWYRIIAEDLNAHDLPHDGLDGIEDDTDFDFNDIVLDVAIDQDGKAHCILQAAGATLKIKINNDETLEVHKLFGVEQGVMVNTNAEKRGMKGASKPPVEFTLDGPFQAAKDVKIHVYRQNNWMELVAPEKQAACKIAVGTDFVWPDERVSLKEVYPDFPNYVKDNVDVTDWWQKNTQKK